MATTDPHVMRLSNGESGWELRYRRTPGVWILGSFQYFGLWAPPGLLAGVVGINLVSLSVKSGLGSQAGPLKTWGQAAIALVFGLLICAFAIFSLRHCWHYLRDCISKTIVYRGHIERLDWSPGKGGRMYYLYADSREFEIDKDLYDALQQYEQIILAYKPHLPIVMTVLARA